MKQVIVLFLLILCSSSRLLAQEGDTIFTAKLPEVNVNSTRNWANDTVRYRYNQMKHYVQTVMPYVNAATKLFIEIDNKMDEPGLSNSDRRKFINGKEDAMRTQFEDKVKALNTTQGTLLMKLIARQTGVNIYHILTEFKDPFAAMKWQTWARLHSINLNRKYHPEEEKDLEQIMEDLGYPLPESYTNGTAMNK